jgi:proteic killer suppression protein
VAEGQRHNAWRYYRLPLLSGVIRSFKDAETERVWRGERSTRLPGNIQDRARNKLRLINRARTVSDLRAPPGNRLHALTGDRKGQWSVSINEQWRICFNGRDGDACDVEIVDYH